MVNKPQVKKTVTAKKRYNISDVDAVLLAARTLILDKNAWTKGAYSRDGKGRSTEVDLGCKWCASGAILFVLGDFNFSNDLKAQNRLEKYIPTLKSLVEYNDSHSHKDIIALFDRALINR